VRTAIVSKKALALAAVLASAIAAGGCGGSASIHANVVAASDVNPDARGRPSPIAIKVFELKSLAPFETADFFSLFEKDKQTLGAELLARDELTLTPGERTLIARDLMPETRYVGVVAAYRDLERATWRAVVPTPPKKTTSIKVQLDSARVSIVLQ